MSTATEIRKVATELNGKLGPTLVSALAGARDRHAARHWEAGTIEPTVREAERLRFALGIWEKISAAEGDDVARQWFIGANPWIDDESAVQAIAEDRFKNLDRAAEAMITGAFNG